MNIRNLIIVCTIPVVAVAACLIMGFPVWWGFVASFVLNFVLGFKFPIIPRR